MLYPVNPTFGEGWKVPKENRTFCEDEFNTHDNITAARRMVEACFKKNAYSFNETVLFANGQYKHKPKVTGGGVVHYVKPLKESIDPNKNKRFVLGLNPNMSYFVGIADPNFLMVSTNPSAVPYILRSIGLNSGYHSYFLMVSFVM